MWKYYLGYCEAVFTERAFVFTVARKHLSKRHASLTLMALP
jgi:hypothetical protein